MKITPEVLEEIHHLHSLGVKDADIALKIGCSKATVCVYRNGRQVNRNKPKPIPVAPVKWEMPESADYSILPDNVLFNHKQFPSF